MDYINNGLQYIDPKTAEKPDRGYLARQKWRKNGVDQSVILESLSIFGVVKNGKWVQIDAGSIDTSTNLISRAEAEFRGLDIDEL